MSDRKVEDLQSLSMGKLLKEMLNPADQAGGGPNEQGRADEETEDDPLTSPDLEAVDRAAQAQSSSGMSFRIRSNNRRSS
jgi:hypothetical protein